MSLELLVLRFSILSIPKKWKILYFKTISTLLGEIEYQMNVFLQHQVMIGTSIIFFPRHFRKIISIHISSEEIKYFQMFCV